MKFKGKSLKIFCSLLIFSIVFYSSIQNIIEIVEYYNLKFRDLEKLAQTNEKYKIFSVEKDKLNEFNSKVVYKKENEFWFDGKLFDILKYEEKDGQILIFCFQDDEEVFFISKLLSKMEKRLFGLLNSINEEILKLKRLINIQSILNFNDIQIYLYCHPVKVGMTFFALLSPIIPVIKPPPNKF